VTDDLIEQAARALCDHECDPGWWDATDDEEREHYRRTIRALLPIVEAHGRASAATALNRAADAADAADAVFRAGDSDEGETWAKWLRIRAAEAAR
jgi:ethanolamine ammonia-lyase small subunit